MIDLLEFSKEILPATAIVGIFASLIGVVISTFVILNLKKKSVNYRRDSTINLLLGKKYLDVATKQIDELQIVAAAKTRKGNQELQKQLSDIEKNLVLSLSSLNAGLEYAYADKDFEKGTKRRRNLDALASQVRRQAASTMTTLKSLKKDVAQLGGKTADSKRRNRRRKAK